MLQFSCGDVVPGCCAVFLAPDEQEILTAVAAHALELHQLAVLPPELVAEVRSRILTVA